MSISLEVQSVLRYLNTEPSNLTYGAASVATDTAMGYLSGKQKSAPSGAVTAAIVSVTAIHSELDTDVAAAVAEHQKASDLLEGTKAGDDYEDDPV